MLERDLKICADMAESTGQGAWAELMRRAAEAISSEKWHSSHIRPDSGKPPRLLLCQYRVAVNSKPVIGPLFFDGLEFAYPFQALTKPIVLAWKELVQPQEVIFSLPTEGTLANATG